MKREFRISNFLFDNIKNFIANGGAKMTKQIESLTKESFIVQVLSKYRTYALLDIENKISRLRINQIIERSDNTYLLELIKLREFYEKASFEVLLINFINSAKERYDEEPMSYAKEAFDFLLSKKQFSSFH